MPVATAAPGGGSSTHALEVAAAVAFREKLGFRADRAFVAGTFEDHGFSASAWGVPLDAGEAAEVARRTKVQKDAAAALRTWAADPAFAGAYIDQRARGALVVLTKDDPARARAAVDRLMPAGANARFLRVQHSMAELLALQDRVNADLRAGALAALGVTSTALDARANAVVVGIAADRPEIRAALAGRYGDAVQPRLELPAQGGDACTARDSCAPAKGGIEIVSSYNGNNCTIGFLVQVVGSPDARLLTAGHCVGKSGGTGTARTWRHDGGDMGWAEFSWWNDGADADVALIAPSSGAISGARNLLYRSSSSDIASVDGWQATAAQVQGAIVCRSAAVSGYHCGTIELTNRTKDVDGHSIDHQWVVDFDACPGDSGGPYMAGDIAYGIHSDSTVGCEPGQNEAWYSPMGWVLSVLSARGHPVQLCTSSSCGASTNAWTQGASLDAPSWDAKLIPLSDGRVLHVGGTSGDLLATPAAGATGRTPEIFDPASGAWSDTASPPWAPADCDGQFAVRLGDGRVLVGGGRHVGAGSDDVCTGAHVFDPTDGNTGSWATVAPPPPVLESAGAVLLEDGRAFVTGGSGADGKTPTALAYDAGGDAWTTLAPPPRGAFAPLVLGLADGRVLVSGGYVVSDPAGPGYADVTSTYLYDPGTDDWSTTTGVGARGLAGVVLGDGRVVVAGGQHLSWDGTQHSSFSTKVSRFDPSSGAWTTLASLPTGRAELTLAALGNGFLVAAGGLVSGSSPGGAASRTAEAWDPTSKAWYPVADLNTSHATQAAAVLDDGRLLVAGGGTAVTETYLLGDVIPPTAGTPTTYLRSGANMGVTSAPLRLTWSAASDSGGSGAGTFDIARSMDGGAYGTIATRVTGTSYDTSASGNHLYRFRIRPRDWAGNVGAWKTAAEIRLAVTQQTASSISWTSGWATAKATGYAGGSLKYANSAGKRATYGFTGRGIAWVSTRGPTRGSARVYIDGNYVKTINLNHPSVSARYVAYARSWSSVGRHTISIVVSGTSGHPRVDVDAFEVITNP